MLTLTYIYLEEPDKADAEMINLLNTEHFYMIDDDVDPIEFKNLYKKFRIDPVFRWGVKGAVNTTQVSVLGNRYVWSASANKGSYKSNMTVNYGVAFEKDLNLMQKRFVLAPEFLLTQSKFTYSNTEIMFVDEQVDQPNHGEVEGIITQSRLQLNALVQFKIDKQYIQPGNYFNLADKFIPYVTIGPSISYLTESGFDGTTNADEQISGSTVDNTDSYNPLMFSVILGAGTKFRFGGMYLSLELRHQYGFGNVVNTDNLYDNKELMSYGYVDNDFRLGQTSFNVGIMFPRFNPKKLIK